VLGRGKGEVGLRLVLGLGRLGKLTVVRMVEDERGGGVMTAARVLSDCVAALSCMRPDL
jgi:hypothetical protein